MKGGFFLRKKPLGSEVSVYSDSGNAIAGYDGCLGNIGYLTGETCNECEMNRARPLPRTGIFVRGLK